MLLTIFMHVFDKIYESRINLNIERLIIHKTTYEVNVLTKVLKICDTAHCQVCCKLRISVTVRLRLL